MSHLKYTIIKTPHQYQEYCNQLEKLISLDRAEFESEIELLTLLIETWDKEHETFRGLDPIEFLKALMNENGLKAKDLTNILNLSKGTVSKILNYQKGLSKNSIRKLSVHFKINQAAFNRPYPLLVSEAEKRLA